MTLNKILLIFIFVLLVSCAFAQTKTPLMPNPELPGNIKLLPGYIYTPGRGIDSAIGRISKENGLEITYDIGPMSGKPAVGTLMQKENVLWSREQEVNGHKLLIVCRKDKVIYAFVPPFTNFMSVIKTDDDLIDFLLMMTTYGSKPIPPAANLPK